MTIQEYQAMRFQAACSTAQGLLANEHWQTASSKLARDLGECVEEGVAKAIVAYSDALLKELGVEEPKE